MTTDMLNLIYKCSSTWHGHGLKYRLRRLNYRLSCATTLLCGNYRLAASAAAAGEYAVNCRNFLGKDLLRRGTAVVRTSLDKLVDEVL